MITNHNLVSLTPRPDCLDGVGWSAILGTSMRTGLECVAAKQGPCHAVVKSVFGLGNRLTCVSTYNPSSWFLQESEDKLIRDFQWIVNRDHQLQLSIKLENVFSKEHF